MRQWWMTPGAHGGVLELRDVPMPRPGPGEVRVRISAAGVNRGELIGRTLLRTGSPGATPRPSGIEFAGEVEGLGDEVSGWAIGDRVIGRGTGCHAEYTVVPAAALMPTPAHLDDQEAAAIPNVFVTAHDALVTSAAMSGDDTVLVAGGASGVGTATIQLARHLGAAHIAATTRSPQKHRALRELGATYIADVSQQDWHLALREQIGPVDVVIDQVGGELVTPLLQTMSLQGRYVTVGRTAGAVAPIDLDLVALQRLTLIGVTFRTRTPSEALACTRRFADQMLHAFGPAGLRPVLHRALSFDELPAAHELMAADAHVGKIVIET